MTEGVVKRKEKERKTDYYNSSHSLAFNAHDPVLN